MGRKRQRTSGAAEHSEEAKGASSKSGGGSGKREAIVDVLADKFLAQGDDRDFASLPLKKDHEQRPMWVLPTGMIFLEATSPLYSIVHDFLVAIAEPVSRPEFLHEYRLTQNSLFTAVSIGLDTEGILTYLDRFSKVAITDNVRRFVRECTKTHGKVKLVLRGGRYFVESTESALLEKLLTHTVIAEARDEAQSRQGGVVGETASSPALQETATAESGLVFHAGALGSMEEDQTTWAARRLETEWYEREEEELQEFLHDMHGKPSKVGACSRPAMRPLTLLVRGRAQVFSFEVVDHAYERVREAALRMGIPLMEEYDFKLDRKNPDIVYHLKPSTSIRSYQATSLNKIFGNGRARSGIIVLPCGAGKTLVGVTAAATVKKGAVVLTTNSVAVGQWRQQFHQWTDIPQERVACFTREAQDKLVDPCILISTFSMVSFRGKRSANAKEVMDIVAGREWGMLILDEVHVAPADQFRRVVELVKSHSKLGLTATLVREDNKIEDLQYLIGPKLYEANWRDLTDLGFLARVRCCELWCPMTAEFFREYLRRKEHMTRKHLAVLNPSKIRVCELLIRYHEEKDDRVIVFFDKVFPLLRFADVIERPVIYGKTPARKRNEIIGRFKAGTIKTIFLSRVGDNAIDLPAANVLIQTDSLGGSRRQEAQRLGRILRPKEGKDPTKPSAYFYSLISTDTREVYHSGRRQQYLVDQGYSFQLLTTGRLERMVAEETGQRPSCLNSRLDQVKLLEKVLMGFESGEATVMEEEESSNLKRQEDYGLQAAGASGGADVGRRPASIRKATSLSGRAGGQGMHYGDFGV